MHIYPVQFYNVPLYEVKVFNIIIRKRDIASVRAPDRRTVNASRFEARHEGGLINFNEPSPLFGGTRVIFGTHQRIIISERAPIT